MSLKRDFVATACGLMNQLRGPVTSQSMKVRSDWSAACFSFTILQVPMYSISLSGKILTQKFLNSATVSSCQVSVRMAAVINAPSISGPQLIVIYSRNQCQTMGCTPGNHESKYTSQRFNTLGTHNVLPPIYRPQQVLFDLILIESRESTHRKCCAVDVRRTSTS
jgi:hypothetical protein